MEKAGQRSLGSEEKAVGVRLVLWSEAGGLTSQPLVIFLSLGALYKVKQPMQELWRQAE